MRWMVAVAAMAVLGAGCQSADSATLVFENVTLIDGTDRGAQPAMSVAVEGTKIVAVGRAGSIEPPPSATRIDGTGMFLIPGLWDNHVHLGGYDEHAFPLFLANGVTTIREVGGVIERVGYLRQEIQGGRLLGPRVLMAGPVLDAPEVVSAYPDGRAAVPTPVEAVKWVDSLAALEVDQIKVHSLTPRAAYFAILARAGEKGIPVVGHVPDSVLISEAIDSGQRTIEHDYRIPYANSARSIPVANWLLAERAAARAKAGANLKLIALWEIGQRANDSVQQLYDSAAAATFAADAADRDVWFDPTLIVLETQYRKNESAIRAPPELKYVPKAALALEDGLPADPNPTASVIQQGRDRYQRVIRQTFGELVRHDAKFLAGSDAPVMPLVPGFSLQRELGLLVEMGLTPLRAIQAASRNAAAAAKRGDLGTIEAGKSADLVLLRADPLMAIANTQQIEAVVVRGRLLDRATLDRMLRDAENYAKRP